jgi:hypothetical protein
MKCQHTVIVINYIQSCTQEKGLSVNYVFCSEFYATAKCIEFKVFIRICNLKPVERYVQYYNKEFKQLQSCLLRNSKRDSSVRWFFAY